MSSGEGCESLAPRILLPASKPPILVMIVEDEPMIAMSLEDAFKDTGHKVVGPFSTCAAALDLLKIMSPDVAVLDTKLKDGSSVQVARDLQQRGVPFLIHSGMSSNWEDALEFADVPWIEKPAPFDDVLGAVAELVNRK